MLVGFKWILWSFWGPYLPNPAFVRRTKNVHVFPTGFNNVISEYFFCSRRHTTCVYMCLRLSGGRASKKHIFGKGATHNLFILFLSVYASCRNWGSNRGGCTHLFVCMLLNYARRRPYTLAHITVYFFQFVEVFPHTCRCSILTFHRFRYHLRVLFEVGVCVCVCGVLSPFYIIKR